jgi:hypothetical protein
MLFVTLKGYHSIRETILGLLANANRHNHLGLSYIIKRSTFSEANLTRSRKVFGDIYMDTYFTYATHLADSCLSDADMERLYIMDSATITLFKDILNGTPIMPVTSSLQRKQSGMLLGSKIMPPMKLGRNLTYLTMRIPGY